MSSDSVLYAPILAFKAGRGVRELGTNTVLCNPTKGAIMLQLSADGFLHFIWKNRETNETEEDLLVFPGDAEFVKIPQARGRVYALKFHSSDERFFFWMQDASSRRDEEFSRNVNRIIQVPTSIPIWDANEGERETSSSTTAGAQASTSSPMRGESSQPGATAPEQLEQLRNIVASLGNQTWRDAVEMSLTDILTPANLSPLFVSHPELVATLYPHLPPDLPVPPSPEVVQRIVNSPQFRAAVQSFDQVLKTGLLGSFLVRGFGLPEGAGASVEAFLKAVQEQASRNESSEGDHMETD